MHCVFVDYTKWIRLSSTKCSAQLWVMFQTTAFHSQCRLLRRTRPRYPSCFFDPPNSHLDGGPLPLQTVPPRDRRSVSHLCALPPEHSVAAAAGQRCARLVRVVHPRTPGPPKIPVPASGRQRARARVRPRAPPRATRFASQWTRAVRCLRRASRAKKCRSLTCFSATTFAHCLGTLSLCFRCSSRPTADI